MMKLVLPKFRGTFEIESVPSNALERLKAVGNQDGITLNENMPRTGDVFIRVSHPVLPQRRAIHQDIFTTAEDLGLSFKFTPDTPLTKAGADNALADLKPQLNLGFTADFETNDQMIFIKYPDTDGDEQQIIYENLASIEKSNTGMVKHNDSKGIEYFYRGYRISVEPNNEEQERLIVVDYKSEVFD